MLKNHIISEECLILILGLQSWLVPVAGESYDFMGDVPQHVDGRRQDPTMPDFGISPSAGNPESQKFTFPSTTKKKQIVRSTVLRVSFAEDCDYLAYYCLRAYDTGILCGRSLYYTYETFKNYCMLDYVNCMERYEVWQVVHMGECFTIKQLTEYEHYPYKDDYFLDQTYVLE